MFRHKCATLAEVSNFSSKSEREQRTDYGIILFFLFITRVYYCNQIVYCVIYYYRKCRYEGVLILSPIECVALLVVNLISHLRQASKR